MRLFHGKIYLKSFLKTLGIKIRTSIQMIGNNSNMNVLKIEKIGLVDPEGCVPGSL